MVYNSTVYKNRRGNTVVLASKLDNSTNVSSRLHDAIAIVSMIVLCIASSIVNVA